MNHDATGDEFKNLMAAALGVHPSDVRFRCGFDMIPNPREPISIRREDGTYREINPWVVIADLANRIRDLEAGR